MKTKSLNPILPFLFIGLAAIVTQCKPVKNQEEKGDADLRSGVADSIFLRREYIGWEADYLKGKLDTSSTKAEPFVDVDPFPVEIDSSSAKIGITRSCNRIKLNGQFISMLADSISVDQMRLMKGWALALNNCIGSCPDTLAAVKVIYGQEGNKLFLYYQPVLLCTTSGKFPVHNGTGQLFRLCSGGNYYYAENGQFKPVAAGDLMTMDNRVNLYRTTPGANPYGVEIQDAAGTWKPFYNSQDDNYAGSAKSIIYPIEQMISVASKTGPPQQVKLWNILKITRYYYNPADRNAYYDYLKHELMMSSGDAMVAGCNIRYGASFSDMSHICPPRCSDFMFTVKP